MRHINKVYGSYIAKIDYKKHDHIFIRSAGLAHETILGAKDLPILKKAIVNFHDPYPVFWYAGTKNGLTSLEMFKMKEMYKVVSQAKICMSSALAMSKDMQYLYSESVFDLSDVDKVLKKSKKITISYQGAIQFGRNIEILLDAYQELVENNAIYKEETEFVLRLKGIDFKKLAAKYSKIPNIVVLETLNFSNSAYEQAHIADINIILENGPLYCNILVGKAPFLASLNKPILSISPIRSELRKIIKENKFIANFEDKVEIKQKLEILIQDRQLSNNPVYPFGDYFSDENFVKMLNKVLND